MERTSHLDPEDICDFIEGELDGERNEAVWEHLDGCAECVRYLAEVTKAVQR